MGHDSTSFHHDDLGEQLSAKQIQLIRATYELIGVSGVEHLALQEVADTAGVSRALIFYHFKTKGNLILTTIRWVLSRAAERIREGIQQAHTAREKVEAMVGQIFVDPGANRRFYRAYLHLVDQAPRLAEFGQLSAAFRSIVNSLYAEVVAQGVEEGVFFADDIDEAATTLRAIVDGLFLQWMQEPDLEEAHDRYRDLCARALLRYLQMAEPAAARDSAGSGRIDDPESGGRPPFA